MVGLIPLSETVHQLVHDNYLFVPTNLVLGDFKKFVNLYDAYIPPEQRDMLERIYEMSQMQYNDYSMLESKHMYIESSGGYKLPSLHELKEKIENMTGIPNNQDTNNNNYDNNKLISPVTFI